MHSIADAFRNGLRGLVRRPGLTASVVLILALGIGLSTAVFSVVRWMLLRPIPVPELGRLVVAWETDPSQIGSVIEVSLPYFLDWRAQSRSFENLAAFGSVNWSYEFKERQPRESVPAAFVSASFFETLRARPLLGRVFRADEDGTGAARALVLSYALWQRRFGGDPGVVGKSLSGSDPAVSVVGVMPREFAFPHGAEAWVLVGPELDTVRRAHSMTPTAFRGLGVLYVLGRLKRGVSPEAAQSELSAISQRLSRADGMSTEGWSARVIPLVDHHLGANVRRALEALAAASFVVLVLACANSAVLLLVEAMTRRTELAVRRALGAGAARLSLHAMADAAVLALVGGFAGAALSMWVVRAVVALGSSDVPALQGATLDGGALAFTFVLTLSVALLVAIAPAAFAGRLPIAHALKTGGGAVGLDRSGVRLTRLMVALELALSLVLLVGSGLLVRSLGKLLQVDLGFVPKGAFSVAVDLAPERYPTPAERRTFYRTLIERIAALPGVQAAGAVHNRPLEHGPIGSDHWVIPEGHPLERASVVAHAISANWEAATPDYFRAMGTRLTAGRAFTEHDGADAPKVAIVSESLARLCWPGMSPLGKRLATAGADVELNDETYVVREWQTVVGVVEDARYRGIQNPRFDVFVPYGQADAELHHVLVRTAGDPLMLASALREQVRELDAEANVDGITSMTTLVDRALAPWRFSSALLGGFAIAGLILTASGLFAVVRRFVELRTREIAIRVALGATPRRVRDFVLAQGLTVTAGGAGLGLLLAPALSRSLRALLYEVEPLDPLSYVAAAAVTVVVAGVACLLPARRAVGVDATLALRSE